MPKKKKTSIWLIVAGLVAVIGVLLVLMPEKKGQPELPKSKLEYKLEKKGAATNADYTDACIALHNTVDAVLSANRITVKQTLDQPRQAARTQVEGEIRWHARHLLVEKQKDVSIDSLRKTIESALSKDKGKILAAQPDTFQGVNAYRLDIGFEDKLDNDLVSIVTDKLYIISDTPSAALPKTPAKARMAIIIDDFGYSGEPIAAFASIKQPLTFAVLPNHPYSNEAAANALNAGHQVMLHLPLEALGHTNGQEQTVISDVMTDSQVQSAVKAELNSIPGVIGINNHQGSKATADRRVMRAVMAVVKANNLFFVDSRTTAASVAAATARQAGVPTAENELFIDNSSDVQSIKQMLRQAAKLALQHGQIVIIGHARPTTAIALREMLPELEAAGIKLVFASQLVK